MKSFLRNTLRDKWYGVSKCYVFGSVVRQDPTRDVDIVVQFDSSNERRVRMSRDRIRKIERSFQEFYELKLHIQTFLCAEDQAVNDFLSVAGAHERIF